MTDDESLFAEPTPAAVSLRLDVSWSATDGSQPENCSVTWENVIPGPEEVTLVLGAILTAGSRPIDTPPARKAEDTDLCDRASCGHPRVHHVVKQGPCRICEESSPPCPSFRELAPVDVYAAPEVDG